MSYIDKWGDRCFAELKLETITYRIDPLLFVKILKKTYNQKVQLNYSNNTTNNQIKLPWFKRVILIFLKPGPSILSVKEKILDTNVPGLFAAVRQIFLRIGTLMHEAGVIDKPRDIFYLGKDEIFNYIRGSALQINLKSCTISVKLNFKIYVRT